MERSQRDNILTLVSQLQEMEIEAIAKEVYPTSDLAVLKVSEYPLTDIIEMLNRSIRQLKQEFEVGEWQVLPQSYNHPEQGSGALPTHLQRIINVLVGRQNFNQLLGNLLWIVGYQVNHAFWDRSKVKVYGIETTKLAKQQTKLSLLEKEIEHRIKEVDQLKKQLVVSQEQLVKFQQQKQQEFSTITANQEQSNQLLSGIRTFQNEANTSKADINAILTQQKQYLEDTRNNLEHDRHLFDKFKTEYESLQATVNKHITSLETQRDFFEKIIHHAQQQDAFLRDKEEEIKKLAGFAADVSLGHTFSRRERQIQVSVWIWAGLSIAITCGALWWVYHVFQMFPTRTDTGFSWSETILNFLRAAPGFILMYFAIAQYSKERNLQEEYAFKAAVSMTVTAYSDMISGNGTEKIDLIRQTVRGIYVPPHITKENAPLIFSTKHLADTAKHLSEVVDKLKSNGGLGQQP